MRHKMEDFPKLADEIKELVTIGRWSMYKCEDGSFYIRRGGKPTCPCGHSDETLYHTVDSDGNTSEEMTVEPSSKPIESITFELPERITKHYLKARF